MAGEGIHEHLVLGAFPDQPQVSYLNHRLCPGKNCVACGTFVPFSSFQEKRTKFSDAQDVVPVDDGFFGHIRSRTDLKTFIKNGLARDDIEIKRVIRLILCPVLSITLEIALVSAQGVDEIVTVEPLGAQAEIRKIDRQDFKLTVPPPQLIRRKGGKIKA